MQFFVSDLRYIALELYDLKKKVTGWRVAKQHLTVFKSKGVIEVTAFIAIIVLSLHFHIFSP